LRNGGVDGNGTDAFDLEGHRARGREHSAVVDGAAADAALSRSTRLVGDAHLWQLRFDPRGQRFDAARLPRGRSNTILRHTERSQLGPDLLRALSGSLCLRKAARSVVEPG